jgi:hypothetical protein
MGSDSGANSHDGGQKMMGNPSHGEDSKKMWGSALPISGDNNR